MALDEPVKISKLDAGTKRTWKFHQSLDELQKWSMYLQMSSERFLEELDGYNSRSIFDSTGGKKLYQDTTDCLQTLKKQGALLKTLARRMRGPR